MKPMKRGKYEITRFDLYTPRIAQDIIEIEADKYGKTFSIQQMPNGRTRIFCIFIGARGSVILLEIAVAEETKRRFYERVKDSVEYVIRNWWLPMFGWELLRFVWDIFCRM